MLKKALEDGSDVQLALQSFKNSVHDGCSAYQALLLFSCRCGTSLPMQRTMLKPQLVVDVSRNRKVTMQYKSSHQLAPIAPGRSIRTTLPNKDSWILGECKTKLPNVRILVLVNGQM